VKQRVLFLDHTPFIGGAELALVRHIKYLDKSRFEPMVICSGTVLELVRQFKEAGARVFVVPFEQLKVLNPTVVLRFMRVLGAAWGFVKKENVDLVVTNTERAMYVGTVAAILSRCKLIWWVRDFEYNRFLFRLLSLFPQKIICVSEAIRDYYLRSKLQGAKRRHYSLQGNPKAEVVYVGSDFDQKLKKVSLEDVLRVKEELGLTGAGLVVGYVGRLVGWKGANVLLDAARGIKGVKGLKVVIVGTGKGQEGNVEPELRRMVKEGGLEDTVILTGQRDDVPVLMKIFDVFCHTSIEPEPFATVVVEAMMDGVPIIGTNIGGTPEIISHGRTGFLVPPNDPAALAGVLSHLASDQNLRQKVGRAGQRLAAMKHTEEIVTKQVEKLYNAVVAGC
jgi:glycosyltransferase involved in cell wall biosynthesis